MLRRREPVEAAVLAAAAAPRRRAAGSTEWRHLRPAITGDDLLAAGLRGPAIGAGPGGRDARALLDGRGAGPDVAAGRGARCSVQGDQPL